MITIDDFAKLEIKLGKILSAELVEGSDKLVLFNIDLGEETGPRQILSGVRAYFPDEQVLIGKTVPVIANLEPRTIRGHVSNGMILYGIQKDEGGEILTTLEPNKELIPGSLVS